MNQNIYQKLVVQSLPRLLSLFDDDRISSSYGMGDRFYWAWGLIDFGNGTYQGAAHGLARLLVDNLLPDQFYETNILNRIDALFLGADRLRRRNGSMEEAFPYEGSFCVTALVAFDLLSAIEVLDNYLVAEKRQQYLGIVRPMINYLHKADESHAFISNHLATAVAALVKWTLLTNEPGETRGKDILQRILNQQSKEGWFNEYGGADPGYQSLCTYYLADVHRMRPEYELLEPLRRSIQFLCLFAHPDGSFGGIYGSRNTRFYYPAGIEYLANEIPEAASLAAFMRLAITEQRVVTLESMDEPNLIPMFNSYCWAAKTAKENIYSNEIVLPCKAKPFRKWFPGAGLILDRGNDYYTIINAYKGGVVYHFTKEKLSYIDTGLAFKDNNGYYYSTQSCQIKNNVNFEADTVTITADIKPATRKLLRPWQFIVLRSMNITVMRFYWVRELVKKILVKVLITGGSRKYGINVRKIHYGSEIEIFDVPHSKRNLKLIQECRSFRAIHMASQGYWQIGDEQ